LTLFFLILRWGGQRVGIQDRPQLLGGPVGAIGAHSERVEL
jgi:hypothetical protein